MAEIADRYGPLPGDVVLLGELMGVKAIARRLGALALEISARARRDRAARRRRAPAALAAGWQRLPDGARSRVRRRRRRPCRRGRPSARRALLAVARSCYAESW